MKSFSFSDEEVELLAELEHERWSKAMIARGWTYGDSRDDDSKVHPDIVDWEKLPEDRREIDREHVRAIPGLVALLRLRIARQNRIQTGRRSHRDLGDVLRGRLIRRGDDWREAGEHSKRKWPLI